MNKRRNRREFKVTAVKLAMHPSLQTQDVAAALKIHPFMPSRWKREDLEGKLQGPAHPNSKEIESIDDERYAAGLVRDIIHRCRQPTAAPDLHSSQRHSRE